MSSGTCQNGGGREGGGVSGNESWGEGGNESRGEGGELCGYGSRRKSRHRGLGGCGGVWGCGGVGERRRQWWEVERTPEVDGVARQTVGSSDGLNTHIEAARQRVEGVTRLYNVHDPAEGRAAGVGRWSGAGVEGGRQVNLLASVDGRRAQAVGPHQCIGGDASPPCQAGECVTPLYDIDNPARRSRATGHQG